MSARSIRRLILGTAGHIDHGKTALVRALTGVDTDRLAEEKERGITIDLGFADLADGDVRFGIVDVPGHEGFVRNMLAGATGMDVAMLVVAADDGVMPQTREHLAILELLDVRRLVVVLTKCDVADSDWADLVEEEVRDTIAATRFAGAAIVRTSAIAGTGLDELREALLAAAADVVRDARDTLLLPVDRVFTIRGTGTVVTGTLVSGRIAVGDTVRIRPGSAEARVRGLQSHGADAESAEAGARVAVALAGQGVDVDALGRGQALVAEPRWEASRMLTVRLRMVRRTEWTLADGQRVRVHLGTAEVMARCALLDRGPGDASEGAPRELGPGEEGWVQLRLESAAVARVGMRLVIRAWSPVTTIGGGVVAELRSERRRGPIGGDVAANLEGRIAPDEAVRVRAALESHGARGVHVDLLPVSTGLPPDTVAQVLASGPFKQAARAGDGTVFSADTVRHFQRRVREAAATLHAAEPFRAGLDVAHARSLAPGDAHAAFADAALTVAVAAGDLVVEAGVVRLPDFVPSLSDVQRELMKRVASFYEAAGLEPPGLDGVPEDIRGDPAFHTILEMLERDGHLVRIDDGTRIDRSALDAAIDRVREAFTGRGDLGPTDFREVIPVSRRYLLPILEVLDRRGVTRFEGGVRRVEEDPTG
jgi:selenocysteine-specific elongation factor